MKFFAPLFLALFVVVALISSTSAYPSPDAEPGFLRYGGYGGYGGGFGRYGGGYGGFGGGFGRGFGGFYG